MRKGTIPCLPLFACLAFAACAGAEETDAEKLVPGQAAPVVRIEEITVVAERDLLAEPTLESPALEPVKTTMTLAELSLIQPATASEALAAAPFIHTETRGRKYKAFHSFRGQVYPYPDVLFDGLWHRDGRDTVYVYPGSMIERVEIMRSPATLFHGLADVVGAITLAPRKPVPGRDEPARWTAGAEGGRLGARRGHLVAEFPVGDRLALGLGGQHYRVDGREGRNAAERVSSVFGQAVYEPDPDHRYEAGAWFLAGFRELEMPDPGGPALNSLKNRRERYDPINYFHGNLRGLHRWSDRATTDWRVFYTDCRARYARVKIDPAGPGPGDAAADENDRDFGLQFTQGLALGESNTLRAGLFLHRYTAPAGRQSYVGSRQDIGSYALVLADEHRAGDWTIDVGVRYARSYYHNFTNPGFTITGQSINARTVSNEWDKPVLTGTAGVTRRLNGAGLLYAHAGIGERRPGPGAVPEPGETLDAEKRYTADLGWQSSPGRRGSGRFRVGGFGIRRADAILRGALTDLDDRGNQFYLSRNRDLRQYGLEAEVESPRLREERLTVSGALTWMRSEAADNGTWEKFREVPSVVFSTAARLAEGPWDAVLRAKYVNRYRNSRFAQDGHYHDLGDYVDLGLTVGFRAGREQNIRFYAAVDNLLDKDYSTVVGWSHPGRGFRFGAEAGF